MVALAFTPLAASAAVRPFDLSPTAARTSSSSASASASAASAMGSSHAVSCFNGARTLRMLSRRQRVSTPNCSTTTARASSSSSSSSDREERRRGRQQRGFGAMPRGMGGSFFDNDGDNNAAAAPASSSSTFSSALLMSNPIAALAPLFLLADGGLADDIKPSYFASLGLFVLSAPGLWSLVKRSAKSKVDRKTFEVAGPSAEQALPLDELAREIFMFYKRNNYVIADAGEVITFEGNIAPERGTAAYITFCVAVGLLCIGLVCSIALPGGNLWYSLALISPLSGSYYMANAGRKEQVKVKMVTADDDMTTDIIVEGDVEEIERMRRDLNLIEKGKVYVKGILEQ